MTTDGLIKMQKMRSSGMTFQQIADCFGVSRQYVWQCLKDYERITESKNKLWKHPEEWGR